MRSASPAFMRALYNDRRDYQCKVYITLTDATVIHGTETEYDYDTGEETVTDVSYLTNENILENGLTIEDAVSNDDEFQIGAAIINKATVVIGNTDEQYNDYDFMGANVVIYVGLTDLDDGTDEFLKMGTYIVDEADYDDGVITLTCLDYMVKFDKPYTDHIAYPAYLQDIVADCCAKCGVVADVSVSTFPIYNNQILWSPPEESTTYRQVVAWAAELSAKFARCNTDGELCIGFYDFTTLNSILSNSLDGGEFDDGTPTYDTGDTADGGSFNPWSTGYVADGGTFDNTPNIHVISEYFSGKVAVSDVEITGVSVDVNVYDEWRSQLYTWIPAYSTTATYDIGDYVRKDTIYKCTSPVTVPGAFNESKWTDQVSEVTVKTGTDGYVVKVTGNELTKNGYGPSMITALGNALIGLRFRPANIMHISDPTIEAGDIALFYDRKNREYCIVVSSTSFSIDGQQHTVSSAASRLTGGASSSGGGSSGGSGSTVALLKTAYPVGSIYMSVNNTNPGELFGGTWEQLKDRFLLGAGDTYTVGNTGGEAAHTLTANEMPAHTHKAGTNSGHYAFGGGSTASGPAAGTGFATALTSIDTGSSGGEQSHNNMPPYLVVYMWQRIA